MLITEIWEIHYYIKREMKNISLYPKPMTIKPVDAHSYQYFIT